MEDAVPQLTERGPQSLKIKIKNEKEFFKISVQTSKNTKLKLQGHTNIHQKPS